MRLRMKWLALFALLTSVATLRVRSEENAASPSEVRRAVVKMLRNESLAPTKATKHDSLVQLCDMYVAIRLHPLYANSEMLQGEAVRIRRRLISEADRLSDRLKRENIARPASLSDRVDQAVKDAYSDVEPESPIKVAGEGGAAIGDEGWALVELIQRTVHPDFWEVTGGPGSIRYFAIKRVLVVRATTQVHEDLVALLRQL
jgi:hypothetical protein